jgi:alkaline phosphatase
MLRVFITSLSIIGIVVPQLLAQGPAAEVTAPADPLRDMQTLAIEQQQAAWGHWGNQPERYSTWLGHSNRLIPVYSFGITLNSWRERGSAYTDPQRLRQLYGRVPAGTVNPTATYYDQTDLYDLQQTAVEAGYRNLILIVFDGMDWQTTRAAALYKRHRREYESGRGTGLAFQDDRRTITDFALVCTSPRSAAVKIDVNAQALIDGTGEPSGGYDPRRGGEAPWLERSASDYLLGLDREQPHTVTDSAASATSLFSGIKTFNNAINFAADGSQVVPLARQLQAEHDFRIGIVTDVPVSHATPAAAYANNVTRNDFQDIARDLVGLPSAAHRDQPLSGVDVLIGAGWGEVKKAESAQGDNALPGNPYFHQDDLRRIDRNHGGRYVVAQRTAGESGGKLLLAAAERAADEDQRLLGWFGVQGGHLPFRTADGRFNPTYDATGIETYTQADLDENPTLAEMTRAALVVLERSVEGFWLLVEAGDVDWANHANNLDSSIGSVLGGEQAFHVVMDWVDENDAWSETAVIVTSDHGHYLVIDDPDSIARAGEASDRGAASQSSGP